MNWQIELAGVHHLKADDFREGNIIEHIEVVTGVKPSPGLLDALIGAPHERAASEYHEKYRTYVNGLIERVSEGSLSFISITPAYGCEMMALCETVVASEVC